MNLILLVLHDAERLDDVLSAWDEAGVSGVTILYSTGLARIRNRSGLREDLPLIPGLEDFHEHTETLNRTIFTIVHNDEMVMKVVKATEAVVGNLNLPNTGILSVLPVSQVFGLDRINLDDYEDSDH